MHSTRLPVITATTLCQKSQWDVFGTSTRGLQFTVKLQTRADRGTERSGRVSQCFCLFRYSLAVHLELSSLALFFKNVVHGAYGTVCNTQYSVFRFIIFSRPPQITQHYSTEYAYGGGTTAFSFPLLVSYLPLSTTIEEFRNMLAIVLRRFVLPRDTARKVCMVVQFPLPWNSLERLF